MSMICNGLINERVIWYRVYSNGHDKGDAKAAYRIWCDLMGLKETYNFIRRREGE